MKIKSSVYEDEETTKFRLKLKWVPANDPDGYNAELLAYGDEVLGSYWGKKSYKNIGGAHPHCAWYKGRLVGEFITMEDAKQSVEDRAVDVFLSVKAPHQQGYTEKVE